MSSIQPAASASSSSALSPFRHRAFAVIWGAVLVANIGAWMQNAASSWLMTALDSEPGIVALVQVATAFPMFLIGLPAGALADIFDRRRLLLTMETVGTLLTAGFAVLVMLDRVTPAILLGFVFLSSAASASIAPAWQAIVPQLAGRKELPAAIALISTGVNISRAIGPALAGWFIAWWGLASPFWIYVVSNVGCIAALFWWRPPAGTGADLPPERFGNAIVVGLRHARYNPPLRATLLRAAGFFFFACAYWALLPLVARTQLSSGPELYGLLLGAIGVGAVVGALVLPRFKQWLGADRLVELGSVGTALALLLFGLARQPAVALTASAVAGLSWISVLATLNVSAQVALPEWVRGRGLAAYVTAMFGAMALGSLVWGEVASLTSLSAAHNIAAVGMLGTVLLLRRWKLQMGAKLDLTPSMHWPAPVLSDEVEYDRGPVLVTLEYRISPQDRDAFLAAIHRAAPERKRDGAYRWGVFEDVAQEGRWLETFMVDSWLEHIRQHQRVTNVDRALEQAVYRFLIDGPPRITHFIAPEAASDGDPGETLSEAEDARQRNRRTGSD